MIADIRNVSENCSACGKERLKLRSHQAPLKLFKLSKPLEFIAIDTLGPLIRASDGQRYIVAITYRFSKLTRAIPLRSIKAFPVAKALVQH